MGKLKLLFCCFIFFSFTEYAYAQEKTNYAVLVGIEKYKDSNIKGCETSFKDTHELEKILKNNFNFKTTLILDSKATKKNIKNQLYELAKKVKPEDNIIIYWSLKSEIEPLYGYGWWLTYDSVYGDTLTYLDSVEFAKGLASVKGSVLFIVNGEAPPGFASGSFQSFTSQDKRGAKLLITGKNTNDFFKANEKGLSILGAGLLSFLGKVDSKGFSANAMAAFLKENKSLRFSSLAASHSGNGNIEFLNVPVLEKQAAADVNKVITNTEPKKQKPVLNINTNPEGCKIYINNNLVGTSPLDQYSIESGSYIIKAVKKDFESKTQKISLKDGAVETFDFKLKKNLPEKGFLTINSFPSVAVVKFVDLKKTYQNNISLDPGTYKLSLSAPFYEDTLVSLKVRPSAKEVYDIKLKPVESFTNSLNQKYIRISKGDFMMGSPLDEVRRDIDEPLHKVKISKDFFMLDSEVTLKEWKQFVLDSAYKPTSFANSGAEVWIGYTWDKDRDYSYENPGFEQKDNEPVTCISYIDAVAFANWLSKKEGINYMLPTEAQWEYACRGGTSTDFAYGNRLLDTQANFAANSKRGDCPEGKFINRTIPVKSLEPNKSGLYDMHGNLMEWCLDYYGSYSKLDEVIDPKGPPTGKFRVLRGGGWDTDINNIRVANRFKDLPESAKNNIGFRLIVEIN